MPLTSSLYNRHSDESMVEADAPPVLPDLRVGGRFRCYSTGLRPNKRGRPSRPSFKPLEELIRALPCGQELCLDTGSAAELEMVKREARRILRQQDMGAEWRGDEKVTVSLVVNPEVTSARPWTVQRSLRWRCYLLITNKGTASGWMAPSEEATLAYSGAGE